MYIYIDIYTHQYTYETGLPVAELHPHPSTSTHHHHTKGKGKKKKKKERSQQWPFIYPLHIYSDQTMLKPGFTFSTIPCHFDPCLLGKLRLNGGRVYILPGKP